MGQYRKERLANLIRTVVSTAVAHRLHDPRLEPLTTVTRVEMSADMYFARVYVSVPGGEVAERRTEKALQKASGFIRKMLAQELTIRYCPELTFEVDRTIKKVQRTMELLDEINPVSGSPSGLDDGGGYDEEEYDEDAEVGDATHAEHDEATPESKD